MRKSLSLLAVIVCMLSAMLSLRADGIRIWEADSGLGNIADKAKITSYLDNLKAHSVNGLWVQVELYNDGTVNYKKTTLSKLPTAQRFTTGQWANDDFLSYMISQAKARGMKVMVKLHGSNHAAWDKHPDWRKRDSKGKEVLWGRALKNFCVNSPYWDQIFFPMVKEIAQNYDIDGIYLDTCQVAYEGDDACFCQACKARFEKETGKKLPLKPVDQKNWADPLVKQHAIKRVEWVNRFYEKFSKAVTAAKPGIEVMLNVSGGYNSYKDTVSSRHAASCVTTVTPEPVETPRMYAGVTNRSLIKAKQKPRDENELAFDEIVPSMNRYGNMEFVTKLMIADGNRKPVVPFSRLWFTYDDIPGMGPVDLEINQIESAIGAGAKGWCFFGYLAHALETGAAKTGTWTNPKFEAYLKDITSGPMSKWLADMEPDSRIGILVSPDASFWNAGYWERFKDIGRLFAFLQFQRKVSTAIIAASEPDIPGFGDTGYKLTKDILSRYRLVIVPGLDYISVADMQTLKDYYDGGGKIIFMGAMGRHGKFLGGDTTDDAYRLFGLTTVGDPVPSGFLKPTQGNHPMFMAMGTGKARIFRYASDKYDALSYKLKFNDTWDVLAEEVTDTETRPAMLYTRDSRFDPNNGAIGYVNTDMTRSFTSDGWMLMSNLIVVVPSRVDSLMVAKMSPTSSVNAFASADRMARYVHIFTPEGEHGYYHVRLRAESNVYPISAEVIANGGEPRPLAIIQGNRDPGPGECMVTPGGHCTINPGDLSPGFAMIKVVYEQRTTKPDAKAE